MCNAHQTLGVVVFRCCASTVTAISFFFSPTSSPSFRERRAKQRRVSNEQCRFAARTCQDGCTSRFHRPRDPSRQFRFGQSDMTSPREKQPTTTTPRQEEARRQEKSSCCSGVRSVLLLLWGLSAEVHGHALGSETPPSICMTMGFWKLHESLGSPEADPRWRYPGRSDWFFGVRMNFGTIA